MSPSPVALVVLGTLLAACGGGGDTASVPLHGLAVADTSNERVLVYAAPFGSGMSAAVVLGQAGFNTRTMGAGSNGLSTPTGIAVDAQRRLYVADRENDRIVRYTPPLVSGMAADLVLGQASLDAHVVVSTAAGLNYPASVAVDANGNVWASDSINHRVLRYVPPLTSGMSATLVIGQGDFTSVAANRGGSVAADSLNNTRHLAFDAAGNLWVADNLNNRVLKFALPFSNGMAATVALGQTSLTASTAVGTPTSATLTYPCGVAFDAAGHLWIADSGKHRVLRFTAPFSTGMSADLVLGQAAFDTNVAATTQGGLSSPIGIAFDPEGRLLVTESVNSRTVVYAPPFTSGMTATLVLGQPDFTTATIVDPPTAASQAWSFGVVAY